jgi:aspartyl-tRNA(Asn)/glutamyl-tRNA(Gln) amidotransferase subunit A
MSRAPSHAENPGQIAELAREIRSGALTATALLERYLARIDAVEPHVEAWRLVARETARAEAAALDAEARAGRFRGPLHGIPVGIKDIIDVAGMTTLANSRSRADIAPARGDAEIVTALRLAGAVILGKTHTTEFACFDPSPARNPHRLAHTPGGSSSGSAAAVAAGMVPLSLGTQTVASVNRPAAYCGIAAFKPSTQSTCTAGVVALAPAFDTIGFYGATVPDAVALFEAVAPAFENPAALGAAPPVAPRTAQIVQLQDDVLQECDPEILRAVGDVAAALAASGHQLRKAASVESFKRLFDIQLDAMRFEAHAIHGALRSAPAGAVGPKFLEILAAGSAITPEAYRDLRRQLAAARENFWRHFPNVDAILFPATPKTAPEGLDWTGDPRYISPWTALGGPIVTQPLGLHSNGLPIGMLLCSRPGTDPTLARLACTLA